MFTKKNQWGCFDLTLNDAQKKLIKDLLIEYGFLVRPIVTDPKFQAEFCYGIEDPVTGIIEKKPMKYGVLLYKIYKDPELKEFYLTNKDILCGRLIDNAVSISEGVMPKSPVPASVRLEAIKFSLRILNPQLFKEKEIEFATLFENTRNDKETVKNWLAAKREKNDLID